MQRLVLASGNPGKLAEFHALLADAGFEVHPQSEFAVEDVPPSDPAPWEHRRGVPMGRYFPSDGALAARIVVYRRPVEERAHDRDDLAELVRTVVVEQVAHMLGRDRIYSVRFANLRG